MRQDQNLLYVTELASSLGIDVRQEWERHSSLVQPPKYTYRPKRITPDLLNRKVYYFTEFGLVGPTAAGADGGAGDDGGDSDGGDGGDGPTGDASGFEVDVGNRVIHLALDGVPRVAREAHASSWCRALNSQEVLAAGTGAPSGMSHTAKFWKSPA